MEVLHSCWVVATSALPAGIAFSNALAATHRLCISAEKDYFEGPDAAVIEQLTRECLRDGVPT